MYRQPGTAKKQTMGGDGGVIASSRRYMRGAGTADSTGDAARYKAEKDSQLAEHEAATTMRYCAVSNEPLQYKEQAIVVCPYGKLYNKEKAIEALLRRKRGERDELGSHIRGMKDLHNLRFHLVVGSDGTEKPACPVTGRELNGLIPAFALIPGNDEQVNVVSDHGIKQLGDSALVEEYGPIKQRIALAPTEEAITDIKKSWEESQAAEKAAKAAKQAKKRKREDKSEIVGRKSTVRDSSAVTVARSRVAAAVQNNEVLSSLFK